MASFEQHGFGAFRAQLAELLSSEHVIQLATVLNLSRNKIAQLREHRSPGLLFTEFITDEGVISPNSISRLTEALCQLNLNGVAYDVGSAWGYYEKRKSGSRLSKLMHVISKPIRAVIKRTKKYSSTPDFPDHFVKDPLQEDILKEEQSPCNEEEQEGNLFFMWGEDAYVIAEGDPFARFLQKLGLKQELSVKDILKIHEFHLRMKVPVTPNNVVNVFLSRLMSYDYRAPYTFSELFKNAVKSREENFVKHKGWINAVQPETGGPSETDGAQRISCRDGVLATILCSDPFLLQEIIGKMTECQLAVPLLLPNPTTNQVTMLLWGLRQVKKTWAEDSGEVHEVSVTEDYFPTIIFFRLGSIAVSKSTILNLMLGSVQGKDDHPFFFSSRQDVKCPEFSGGVLEGFWFQPNDGRQTQHSFLSATCFLNLRGDATNFSLQRTFACKFAPLVVVFVNSSNVLVHKEAIDSMSQNTEVILVALTEKECATSVQKVQKVTVCNFSTKNDRLIAETLCDVLRDKFKENVKESSLAIEGVKLSQSIGIRIDMFSEVCQSAKENAKQILNGAHQSPREYKASALKLQESWRQWTEVDKDRSWQANDCKIEELLSQRDLKKKEHRENQLQIGASQPIKHFYEYLLRAPDVKMQFISLWLQILLNEISQCFLSDLIKDIQILGRQSSNIKKEITSNNREIEERENLSEKEKKDKAECVMNLEAKDKELTKKRLEAAKEFDKASVGFEHLLREIGQWYESQCEIKTTNITKEQQLLKNTLPKLVAKLLLRGQPIEILDGDACHVPVIWVKGLFEAVKSEIGYDARIFIISVLGIQSSGKSTLLNSMFGVRFAVSAGRCTRGVYMQMLEVEKGLRNVLKCDFLVIIDTEGLRAPERSIAGTPDLDNELATFSLCLSNVTLINIGGQTVGDDLTDVLQVAAHAFIRMKKVQLQSSCRLVQQFVADLTARAKNENSTQSIKQKLDEAIKTAAKEEGMHRKYHQFTDVFNILNDDDMRDLQYIPSLWRSSTAPPNYSYSEKVLELKASILDGIKSSTSSFLSISQFGIRINDVWKAVKQEDFVFNFKNSIIMAQFKNFQELYQSLKVDIRRDTMSIELQRKDEIAMAAAERIEEVLSISKMDLRCIIEEKYDTAKTKLNEMLGSNSFSEVKRLYEHQFITDLYFSKEVSVSQMELKLGVAAQKTKEKKMNEDTHLPKLKAELRQRVRAVAEDLRDLYSNHLKEGKNIPEEKIKEEFDEVWKTSMEKIRGCCSSSTDTEVREQVNDMLRRCILNVDQSNFSKFLNVDIQHKDNYQSFSSNTKHVYDTEYAKKLIKYLKNDDTTTIDPVYVNITNIVCRMLPEFKTFSCDNLMSHDTLQDLQKQFKEFLNRNNCQDMNDANWRVTCIAGFTIFMLQEKWKDCLVQFSPEFLKQQELDTTSNSKDTIHERTSEILERKLKEWRIVASAALSHLRKRFSGNRNMKDVYLSEIDTLFDQLIYDQESFESGKLISDFIDSAISIVTSHLESKNREKILREICLRLADSVYHKMMRSKVDWKLMENQYPQITQDYLKITENVLTAIQGIDDTLNLGKIRSDLTPDNIQKLAALPHNSALQSAIDIEILSKLEKHQTPDYSWILKEIRDIKCKFMIDITESGSIDDALISALINDTQKRFPQYLETDEGANLILHMCAWTLPLCSAIQISYEKKHNLVIQLQAKKGNYYKDFKDWCLDSANDTRQAEELYELLEPAMLACVKNRICPTLFGMVAQESVIFKSRQHLIRHMLLHLAEDGDFNKYLLYVRDHEMFTKNWITSYVANMCSKRTPKLNIDSLVSSEIHHVMTVTRQCFTESLPKDTLLSPQCFLGIFLNNCKEKCSVNVDENDFDTLKKFSSSIKDLETYKIEFLNLFDKLPQQLLGDLAIPNEDDIDNTVRWLHRLPEPIDMELGKRVEGCHKQCPFCGSVCDNAPQKHDKHLATLHYPGGIKGIRDKGTKELVCEVCTSEVATNRRYYPHCGCDKVNCDCEWFYYREYKKEYPDWRIRPVLDTEPTSYWKWVMTTFNSDFAKYHNAVQAKIPDTWKEITKDEAIESLTVFVSANS